MERRPVSAKQTKLFYEEHKDKARDLIADMIKYNWTHGQVKEYFYALDYNIFFIQSVVNPFFINPK